MARLTRREFVAGGGGDGRDAGLGRRARPALARRAGWSGATCSAGRGLGRSRRRQRAAVDARLVRRTARARVTLTVEVAEDAAFDARRRDARRRARWPRPTGPAACWSAACSRRATYWYRFIDEDGQRQPHRPHAARRPRRRRPAAGALRLRQLPERVRGRAERLPPDDLRGRARRARRSGSASCCTWATSSTRWSSTRRTGPDGHRYDRRLRDADPLPERREGRRSFHVAGHARGLSRALPRLPAGPRPAGRARALAVRVRCGTTTSSPGRAGSRSSASAARLRPAQTRKVAANQAWFEYQPARVRKPGGASLERFEAPRGGRRADRATSTTHGLGQEPNNLAAIDSLTRYRALRWGRHIDLIITDQHSYRSRGAERPRRGRRRCSSADFPELRPRGGAARCSTPAATYAGGHPPATHSLRRRERRRTSARTSRRRRCWARSRRPGSSSGCARRRRPGRSGAIRWARSTGAPIRRTCPPGLAKPWPGAGYACFAAAATTAARTPSAPRSTTPCAMPASPASRSSPATATASGPACAAKALPPARVRAGGRRLRHRLDLRARPGRGATSTASRRTIRCARCTSPTAGGPAAARRQPAAAPRRALVPGVRSSSGDLRRRARASQSRTWRRT